MRENIVDFLSFWLKNSFLLEEDEVYFNNYYKSFKTNFSEYIKFYYERQSFELKELIAEKSHQKVLDIGCGCGVESVWMALNSAEVTAIDIDPENLLSVCEKIKEITEKQFMTKLKLDIKKINMLDMPVESKYDIVWMEQAFHHLEPRTQVIEKLEQLVKPGGVVLFSETNAYNLLIQLKLLKHRGFKTVVEYGKQTWGNERIITANNLKKLCMHAGWKVEGCSFYRTMPNRKWADKFLKYDKNLPQFLKPVFTHYNLTARKP